MDSVREIKSKMMSEVRLAIEDLVDTGRVTREQVHGKLLGMDDYFLKVLGTPDYIANEMVPLYPFLLPPSPPFLLLFVYHSFIPIAHSE